MRWSPSARPRTTIYHSAAYACVWLMLVSSAATASAAFITTHEAELDAIFSQPAFGNTPIDIRFNAPVVIAVPQLLQITDSAGFLELLLRPELLEFPTPNLIFVDHIDWCSEFDTGIVGCATIGGNHMIVESAAAAGPLGAELLAHELAHNLGLSHPDPPIGNLLDPVLNNNTNLTLAQANTILASALVQTEMVEGELSRFVPVTPVLVNPEPSAFAGLLSIGAVGLFLAGKRRRQKSLWSSGTVTCLRG